mgnify:CR=1 FL=1
MAYTIQNPAIRSTKQKIDEALERYDKAMLDLNYTSNHRPWTTPRDKKFILEEYIRDAKKLKDELIAIVTEAMTKMK